MSQRVTIHLHIDQPLPDGVEEANEIINRYIDELAKTDGELSWQECDWDLYYVLDNDGEQE